MRRTLLASTLLTALLSTSLLACSDDDSGGMSGRTGRDGQQLTCTALLRAAELEYTVSGNTLALNQPGFPASFLTRRGTGTGLLGAWDLAPVTSGGLTAQLTMTVAAGRVSASAACSGSGRRTTASVSSAAEITPTTLTILEDAESTVRF
jgi:hypothetical protein